MKKRILSIVLVMVMAISMLVACGERSNNEGKEKANKEIKLADIKPTLKILGAAGTVDLNDAIETKVVEESTGYDVEFYGLPTENSSQALMLTLANDNDYDLVTLTQSQYNTLVANHALLPLNDYIDAIAPELWDCIPEEAWKGVMDEEGNVYAFPKLYSVDQEIASFMVVRMDLLKKAGINELPTTLSEFKNVLTKLKSYYGDEYIILSGPYNRGTTGLYLDIPFCISAAFGIYNDWMVDDNGKVIYMTEHKNFGNMITYMSDLYTAGILDVDYASNGHKAVDEKFASGKAIIAVNGRETIAVTAATLEKSGVNKDDIVFIPVLQGDDGTCVFMNTEQYASFSAIPVKNPTNAADTVKWMAEKVKNQELIAIGEEGVHFTWDDDGYPEPIQPIFTDERNNSSKLMNFADMETYKVQFMARLKKNDMIWKAYTTCTLQTIENQPDIFTPNYFAYCNGATYVENNTALRESLNDYISLLVVGQRKLNADEGTFASDFNNQEGEAQRKELQAWYDAYDK